MDVCTVVDCGKGGKLSFCLIPTVENKNFVDFFKLFDEIPKGLINCENTISDNFSMALNRGFTCIITT